MPREGTSEPGQGSKTTLIALGCDKTMAFCVVARFFSVGGCGGCDGGPCGMLDGHHLRRTFHFFAGAATSIYGTSSGSRSVHSTTTCSACGLVRASAFRASCPCLCSCFNSGGYAPRLAVCFLPGRLTLPRLAIRPISPGARFIRRLRWPRSIKPRRRGLPGRLPHRPDSCRRCRPRGALDGRPD